jgi:hypothetical protein
MSLTSHDRGAGFGPWLAGISDAERLARLRSLRTAVQLLSPFASALIEELAAAERDSETLWRASATFDLLPSIPRRGLLATTQRIEWGGAR